MSSLNDERIYPFAAPAPPCEGAGNASVTRVTAANGTELWLVSGYSEVRKVLNDWRFSSAATTSDRAPRLGLPLPASNILKKDVPEHTRLRRLVGRAFTARRVQEMRPYIQQTADRLLDEMTQEKNHAELVSEYSIPLSMGVMCHLLGVPFEDRARFGEWTQAVLRLRTSDDAVRMARARLDAYLKRLIAQKRAQPSDDLLTSLITARDQGNQLSEQELIGLGSILLVVGHETTAHQLGFSLLILKRDSGACARALHGDDGQLAAVVDETLRLESILDTGSLRIAIENVTLGEKIIRAGEPVLVSLARADRDPNVFPEPDEFQAERTDAAPHLAFGYGPHHCLGASLARMELQVGLRTLLHRLPNLRLSVPESELHFRTGSLLRGLSVLPVEW